MRISDHGLSPGDVERHLRRCAATPHYFVAGTTKSLGVPPNLNYCARIYCGRPWEDPVHLPPRAPETTKAAS